MSIIPAALLVALSSLLSRVLGLLRDRLFAANFGAGPELDAYFAAYRIPDIVFNLLVLGTLSAAFIPVFNAYLSKGKENEKEAFRVAESLFFVATVILTVFAAILFFLAPVLVPLIAPGFDSDRKELTVVLSRIMLLQPIFLGASSVLGGILTSFNRFVAYAVAPVLYNIGIILGVVFFVPRMGVAGVAWGVVIGAFLHLMVQIPSAVKLGFHFRPSLNLHYESLKDMGKLMVPRLIGLFAGQVNQLVVNIIGSNLMTGSIAVYSFADNLQSVPIGLVGISFAVATFPALSKAAAENSPENFVGTLVRALRMILFIALPFSAAMLLLRAETVRVVLGSGRFDWLDTRMTFSVLSVLVLSVFAQSIIPLLSRAFFAMRDTKTPMAASIIAIVVNVIAAFFLSDRYGVIGLAWAFTLSALVNFLILLTVIHARLGGLKDREFFYALLRISIATLVAGSVIQLVKYPLGNLVNMQTFWGVLTKLVGSSLVGAAAYIFMAYVMGLEECRQLIGRTVFIVLRKKKNNQ